MTTENVVDMWFICGSEMSTGGLLCSADSSDSTIPFQFQQSDLSSFADVSIILSSEGEIRFLNCIGVTLHAIYMAIVCLCNTGYVANVVYLSCHTFLHWHSKASV